MTSTAVRNACLAVALAMWSVPLAATPAAADPHHPLSGRELLESCTTELKANAIPVDEVLAPTSGEAVLRSFNDPNWSTCWNFGWAEITIPIGRLMTVTPTFAGPNINFSGWDCNHSSVTYGVYRWNEGIPPVIRAHWAFAGGGIMYGRLAGQTCRYNVTNFPQQDDWGATNSVQVTSRPLGQTFRIAVQSWSHDDPKLGHTHDLCEDPISCVWDTHLAIGVATPAAAGGRAQRPAAPTSATNRSPNPPPRSGQR